MYGYVQHCPPRGQARGKLPVLGGPTVGGSTGRVSLGSSADVRSDCLQEVGLEVRLGVRVEVGLEVRLEVVLDLLDRLGVLRDKGNDLPAGEG